MKQLSCIIILIGVSISSSLFAQSETKENLRYEIKNLQEQIEVIIQKQQCKPHRA